MNLIRNQWSGPGWPALFDRADPEIGCQHLAGMAPFDTVIASSSHGQNAAGLPSPLGILYIAVKNKAGCLIPIIQTTIKALSHQPTSFYPYAAYIVT